MTDSNEIRTLLEHHGGLVNMSGIADAWGVSLERVRQLAGDASFPEPIAQIRPVWPRSDVMAWRTQRLSDLSRRRPARAGNACQPCGLRCAANQSRATPLAASKLTT